MSTDDKKSDPLGILEAEEDLPCGSLVVAVADSISNPRLPFLEP